MNKKIILGFVFLFLLSSFICAQDLYETEFLVAGKFSLYGTVTNEYNEGNFYIKDGIKATFLLQVDEPLAKQFSGGFTSVQTGEYYPCFNLSLSNSDEDLYGYCNIKPNETGLYLVTFFEEDERFILQTVNLHHSKPLFIHYFYFVMFILFLVGGVYIHQYLTIFSLMFLITGFTSILTYYKYALGEIGEVLLYCVFGILVYLIYFIFKLSEGGTK